MTVILALALAQTLKKNVLKKFFCRPDPGEDDVNLRRRVRLLLKGIKVLSPSNITPVQHFWVPLMCLPIYIMYV